MGSLINSFWSGGVSTPIGDTYTMEVGYSLRKILSTATYSIKIRRDSDDATTDVELHDTASLTLSSTVSAGGTLATWIGANNGYVHTLYDQSGNGHNFTQTTNGSQPQIIASGVVNTENSIATIDFSSNKFMTLSSDFVTSVTEAFSVYIVLTYPTVNPIVNMLLSKTDDGIRVGGTNSSFNRASITGYSTTDDIRGATQNPSGHAIQEGHPNDVYVNNATDTPYSVDISPVEDFGFLTLGKRSDLAWYYNGKLQEIIVFDADTDTDGDRPTIYANINDFYGVT